MNTAFSLAPLFRSSIGFDRFNDLFETALRSFLANGILINDGSGSPSLVRCLTNADCDYGTCPAQLTCAGRGDNPVNCAANSDCQWRDPGTSPYQLFVSGGDPDAPPVVRPEGGRLLVGCGRSGSCPRSSA